ncbi:hypothetical protein AC578_4002 [Pseudocercospora eumusae]|uniref:Uncharacterized protein n=1 Tax=Pseudocercospora eumusae TaxID=321146 RepID=A0A139HLP1_9PEZI|nr:hypothetical protein AC578_4002 [Pseudocercospora eumusae]
MDWSRRRSLVTAGWLSYPEIVCNLAALNAWRIAGTREVWGLSCWAFSYVDQVELMEVFSLGEQTGLFKLSIEFVGESHKRWAQALGRQATIEGQHRQSNHVNLLILRRLGIEELVYTCCKSRQGFLRDIHIRASSEQHPQHYDAQLSSTFRLRTALLSVLGLLAVFQAVRKELT